MTSPQRKYERMFRKLKARKAKFGFECGLSFDTVELLAEVKAYFAANPNTPLWIDLHQGMNIVTVKVYTDDAVAAEEFEQLFAYKE